MIKRRKLALLGAGNIGGMIALLTSQRKLGDVVLYDVVEGIPQGKALDLTHYAPIFNYDIEILGTNKIEDIRGADVCIVTAGFPRKAGMSRNDLVGANGKVIRDMAAAIKLHAPNAFVIVITNPLDVMAYLMQRETGFPQHRVVGMAGVLDAARYQALLAQELGVSVSSIDAMVLGGHGDEMVPVRSHTTCGGIPIATFLGPEVLDRIENRVRGAGGEIITLMKTGGAFYSAAAAATMMAESYLGDRKKVLACSAYCTGQYGISGIYMGVPVIIGGTGVESVMEIELSSPELEALRRSAEGIRKVIQLL